MSRFDKNSRYVKYSDVYLTTDKQGREVMAVTPAELPSEPELGEHLRRDEQRLDHLAAHYLSNPTGFWRIARANDAMTPDVLAQRRRLKIPVKS
jgi:hypothetical protein